VYVTFATEPGDPRRPNEDFVAATPEAVVLLDGAGAADSGCVHGVPWYVRTLGSTLLAALSQSDRTLTEILAEGIKSVTSSHDFTCDLTAPGTPSAAVALLRRNADLLDWLVLRDPVLILQLTDTRELVVIRDQRTPTPEDLTPRTAATDPLAAEDALTGSIPLTHIHSAAALTSGASPPSWPNTLLTPENLTALLRNRTADATAVHMTHFAD
jgi:hypothetical protein